MQQHPILFTDRLLLRAHTLADASAIQRNAGDREVAATTLSIPHPYEEGMAEIWINKSAENFQKNKSINFAIERKRDKQLIGAVGLILELEHERAELGYYLGKSFWNNGYISEAVKCVIDYGFTVLRLNKIHAKHFKHNPTSGRVMQKAGMRHEGSLRQHLIKWGELVDIEMYGILREDYEKNI